MEDTLKRLLEEVNLDSDLEIMLKDHDDDPDDPSGGGCTNKEPVQ